jgi:endogenous inhibitor of DNA gyrase (YacG/DUF329 family)
MPRVVLCPGCKSPVEWIAENKYRPFCSGRCKRGDLGAWANDEYRVAAKEPDQGVPLDLSELES